MTTAQNEKLTALFVRLSSSDAKRKKDAKETIGMILKLLLGIAFISPILMGLLFSFVPTEHLHGFPDLSTVVNSLTLENYKWVLDYIPIGTYMGNSLVVCVIVIVSQTVLASFAAYAFSFFNFRGKNLMFNLILVAMMIPAEVTVIANYLTVQGMGLVNTFIGLSMTNLIGGTSIFMMRQCYLQMPKELKEASLIDGCSDMRFLYKIAVPLSIPTICSLALFLFISVYNMYFWPMLIAQKQQMQTIQIGMAMLVGVETTEYGHILAGAMLCIVIPIITFVIGQKYIISGMTQGAVKG